MAGYEGHSIKDFVDSLADSMQPSPAQNVRERSNEAGKLHGMSEARKKMTRKMQDEGRRAPPKELSAQDKEKIRYAQQKPDDSVSYFPLALHSTLAAMPPNEAQHQQHAAQPQHQPRPVNPYVHAFDAERERRLEEGLRLKQEHEKRMQAKQNYEASLPFSTGDQKELQQLLNSRSTLEREMADGKVHPQAAQAMMDRIDARLQPMMQRMQMSQQFQQKQANGMMMQQRALGLHMDMADGEARARNLLNRTVHIPKEQIGTDQDWHGILDHQGNPKNAPWIDNKKELRLKEMELKAKAQSEHEQRQHEYRMKEMDAKGQGPEAEAKRRKEHYDRYNAAHKVLSKKDKDGNIVSPKDEEIDAHLEKQEQSYQRAQEREQARQKEKRDKPVREANQQLQQDDAAKYEGFRPPQQAPQQVQNPGPPEEVPGQPTAPQEVGQIESPQQDFMRQHVRSSGNQMVPNTANQPPDQDPLTGNVPPPAQIVGNADEDVFGK